MHEITWLSLSWCLLPIALVCFIYSRWQGEVSEVLIASGRMLLQLIGVGYILVLLFANPSPWLSLLILSIMLLAAGWIAVRPVRGVKGFWQAALIGLGMAVAAHLIISLKLVMQVETWYTPTVLIPLAGMYFANTMNAISLAAERYQSELGRQTPEQARFTAFHAAMIPQINGLLAVGLVALPGMMTGQILSGVSPLVAVRYQILIMAMILGTSGMGTAIMLWLISRKPKANST
jgi:UDP-glucose/iron transport system permease protein